MKGNITCPDHCGLQFNPIFLNKLTSINCIIRTATNKEIFITSGPRCPTYNAKIKGVNNSEHTLGLAADIEFLNSNRLFFLVLYSLSQGIFRIGINDMHLFVHLGAGTMLQGFPQEVIWHYK